MRFISSFFIIIICLATAAFALLNAELVSINYLVGERQLPLSLLVILVLLLGIVVGAVLSAKAVIHARLKARSLAKQLESQQTEINTLRAMPVKEHHLWS